MKITSSILKEIGFELVDDHDGKGNGIWQLKISDKENITICRYDEGDNQFILNETGFDGNKHYQVKTISDLLIAVNKSSIFYGKQLKYKSILEFIKTEDIKEYCQKTGSKYEKNLIEYMKEKEGL